MTFWLNSELSSGGSSGGRGRVASDESILARSNELKRKWRLRRHDKL